MRKILKCLKCILPLIVGFAVQICIGVIVYMILSAQVTLEMTGASGTDIQSALMNRYMAAAPYLVFASHISTIIVASIWFYFVSGRKTPGNPTKGFTFLTIPVMLLATIGAQYLCSGFLMVLTHLAPSVMEEYSNHMHSSGIATFTPITIVTVVLLAPIGEELLFRGITMTWLNKVTSKFWLVNLIQALLFGIFHVNIVQGFYAFVMGLIFGYIREKYQSMYAAVLIHALVNFCGVISPLLLQNYEPGLGFGGIITISSLAILVFGLYLARKDTAMLSA